MTVQSHLIREVRLLQSCELDYLRTDPHCSAAGVLPECCEITLQNVFMVAHYTYSGSLLCSHVGPPINFVIIQLCHCSRLHSTLHVVSGIPLVIHACLETLCQYRYCTSDRCSICQEGRARWLSSSHNCSKLTVV